MLNNNLPWGISKEISSPIKKRTSGGCMRKALRISVLTSRRTSKIGPVIRRESHQLFNDLREQDTSMRINLNIINNQSYQKVSHKLKALTTAKKPRSSKL